MATPIKITVVNRPLTCEEHDQNIDALLDRANHTGLQNCNTIESTSLEQCVSDTTVVTNLGVEQLAIENRLTAVELSLQGGGQIQTDLQNVRQELLDEIAVVSGEIGDIELRVTTLENAVDANSGLIASLSTNLGNINLNLQTQINNNASAIGDNDTDITVLQGQVTQLIIDLNQEISDRGIGDGNLQTALDQEIIDRAAADVIINNTIAANENARDIEQTLQDDRMDQIEIDYAAADTIIDQRITNEVATLNATIAALQTQVDDLILPGTIMLWTGASIPPGWLFCDGAVYTIAAYPDLAAVLVNNWGGAVGVTFGVPDFRDRMPYGLNTSAAGVVSGYAGQNHYTLTINEMPIHSHAINFGDHQHTVDYTHQHALQIYGHNHTGGGGGAHFHSMVLPYQQFGENAGTGGYTYRSMVFDECNPPDFAIADTIPPAAADSIPPRTADAVTGAPVGFADIRIYDGGVDPGFNRTDLSGGVIPTTFAGAILQNSGNNGAGQSMDNRSAYTNVKFIIKT